MRGLSSADSSFLSGKRNSPQPLCWLWLASRQGQEQELESRSAERGQACSEEALEQGEPHPHPPACPLVHCSSVILSVHPLPSVCLTDHPALTLHLAAWPLDLCACLSLTPIYLSICLVCGSILLSVCLPAASHSHGPESGGHSQPSAAGAGGGPGHHSVCCPPLPRPPTLWPPGLCPRGRGC